MERMYVEWCLDVYRRKGFMVKVKTLDKILKQHHSPGYSSIYKFEEEDALEIIESKSSKGLDRYDTYADHLTIDIDEGDEGLKAAEDRLSQYEYEVWSSGGKGYHLLIPHEPIKDKRLPWSHRTTVEGLGIICDLSLYQPGRLLSLPNRIHPKTKKRKEYLRTHNGTALSITLEERPKSLFNFDKVDESMFTSLLRLADLSTYTPYRGSRHITIWSSAKNLNKCGVSYEEALTMLQMINRTWKDPKSPEEVTMAVQQAYRG